MCRPGLVLYGFSPIDSPMGLSIKAGHGSFFPA